MIFGLNAENIEAFVGGAGIVGIITAFSYAYVRIRRAKDASAEASHKIDKDKKKTTLAEAFDLIETLQGERNEDRIELNKLRAIENLCQRRLARAEQWIEAAVDKFKEHKIPHPVWRPLPLGEEGSGHHQPLREQPPRPQEGT